MENEKTTFLTRRQVMTAIHIFNYELVCLFRKGLLTANEVYLTASNLFREFDKIVGRPPNHEELEYMTEPLNDPDFTPDFQILE